MCNDYQLMSYFGGLCVIDQGPYASFFFGVRIMLGMTFNYLILWVRVKGQG